MMLTHDTWRVERANLAKSVEVARTAETDGLTAKAFQRALDWIDQHPAASLPMPIPFIKAPRGVDAIAFRGRHTQEGSQDAKRA